MTRRTFLDGKVTLHCGDCLDAIKSIESNSIDSVVTDPPYALVSIAKRFGKDGAVPAKSDGATGVYARASSGFMGVKWDTGEMAFAVEFWQEVYRVLKPGGHVLAFAATRTHHRLACAIEDAGFEIRDMVAWLYGSGFPKSHNVSKAIDRRLGAERGKVRVAASERIGSANAAGCDIKGLTRPWIEKAKAQGYHEVDGPIPATPQAEAWQGWGTALKPALEPVCVARKPLIGSVADNVLVHGTGALNIDGCRIGTEEMAVTASSGTLVSENRSMAGGNYGRVAAGHKSGRWPANIAHDGSDEVLIGFPNSESKRAIVTSRPGSVNGAGSGLPSHTGEYGFDDAGSAARFFYTAKADDIDRIGSKHPTVKPVELMRWLVRLVTPPGGIVLDPFSGTGTTGEAAVIEGCRAILIEREPEYQADIERRMRLVMAGEFEKRAEIVKARGLEADPGPLFGGSDDAPQGGQDGLRGLRPRQGRTIGPIGLKR